MTLADLTRNFGFLLKDAARLSSLNFERHALELKLTLSQCKVLAHLQRNEGITQIRLAALTGTDPMTLVRTLDRMERDGLVERRPDPADRRARCLFLMPAAEPVLEKVRATAEQSRGEALAGLSLADRKQLIALLERVHSNLRALVPGEGDPVTTLHEPPPRQTPASGRPRAIKDGRSAPAKRVRVKK